jgi:putative endonuclease
LFMWFLYIIQSVASNKYYKGISQHPEARLLQHNLNEVRSTSQKGPWKLVALFACATKTEAIIRERKIKKFSTEKLRSKIASDQNLLNQS